MLWVFMILLAEGEFGEFVFYSPPMNFQHHEHRDEANWKLYQLRKIADGREFKWDHFLSSDIIYMN